MANPSKVLTADELLNSLPGDDVFAGAGVRKMENLPAGKALFYVQNSFADRSSKANRLQLNAHCIVIQHEGGSELQGKTYRQVWGLDTVKNLEWFKGNMVSLELMSEDEAKAMTRKDIIRLQNDLVGIVFEGTLADNTDPQYPPSCYINAGARKREYDGMSLNDLLKQFA